MAIRTPTTVAIEKRYKNVSKQWFNYKKCQWLIIVSCPEISIEYLRKFSF